MQEFDEKAIIERIRLLRKEFAGVRGKSKFAHALGISGSTYNYYENDRLPPIPVLLRVCQVTGADLNWLLTGVSGSSKIGFSADAKVMQRSAELARKLDNLLGNSPESVEAVLAFVQLLSEKKAVDGKFGPELPIRGPERPGWIPVLGRTAAGMVHFWDETSLPKPKQAVVELDELVEKHTGKAIMDSVSGAMSVDLQAQPLMKKLKGCGANLIRVSGQKPDEIVEFVECTEIYELFPDSFGLHIDGDSMSPRIDDGDVVVLSPSVPAVQGCMAVAKVANQIGVTCKLIRKTQENVHLIPINERYETKVVPEKELLWGLAVLCHIKEKTGE